MELTKRVALVALAASGGAASGGALTRHITTSLGDAEPPCCPMTLIAWRGFAWN